MTEVALIGERVRRLRVARGLSQSDLAHRASVANGGISMLENGRQALHVDGLNSVARVLDCSIGYLTSSRREPLASRPWLRAYADASQKMVERVVADTLTALDFSDLASLRRIPDTLPLFSGDVTKADSVEAFAQIVRQACGLQHGDVVGNTTRSAEKVGCVVLPLDDELGKHLGLSFRVEGVPVIRVTRSRTNTDSPVPGDRQRFTVAHELGHLSLHHDQSPPADSAQARQYERQAHLFAGAFLAPRAALLDDLAKAGDRVTLSVLAHLKATWGVSIKALVMRFRQLDVISEAQERSLHKQISARRWTKKEPVEVGHESAVWLASSIARRGGETLLKEVETTGGLSRSYVASWSEWAESPGSEASQGQVLAFPKSPRKAGSSTRSPSRNEASGTVSKVRSLPYRGI